MEGADAPVGKAVDFCRTLSEKTTMFAVKPRVGDLFDLRMTRNHSFLKTDKDRFPLTGCISGSNYKCSFPGFV